MLSHRRLLAHCSHWLGGHIGKGRCTGAIGICRQHLQNVMGQDEHTVPGAGRTAEVIGELWVQWRLWAGPSVIQHQRNETAESPRPAAPQTEPCWLSAQATWRHGERPADSWGTGRCHGNRGSRRVTPGQDDKAATS